MKTITIQSVVLVVDKIVAWAVDNERNENLSVYTVLESFDFSIEEEDLQYTLDLLREAFRMKN